MFGEFEGVAWLGVTFRPGSAFVNVLGFGVHCSNFGGVENRRFVEVIVKARKRFEALRDFTVDGALEEVDRIKRERKDAGELTGVASSRNAPLDSTRGSRHTGLRNVPEDSAFAIDDDDEEGEDSDDDPTPKNAPSGAASTVEDGVPIQSRSMSEKARGKQPVNPTSFSRTTSRTTSNASLNTYTTQTNAPQPFEPTPEWVGLRFLRDID